VTTPHRQIVDALIDKLVDGVSSLAGCILYREEPVRHDPNNTHLAVWFEGETPQPEFNTTMTLATGDLYAVRYWQPAPDRPRKVVDEDAAADIEAIMEAAKGVVMANQEGIGTSYATRFGGSRKFIGRDDGAPIGGMVQGFEMAVLTRTFAVYG
jgi:hypothetical protein